MFYINVGYMCQEIRSEARMLSHVLGSESFFPGAGPHWRAERFITFPYFV